MRWLDWLFGLDRLVAIEQIEVFLAAEWARRGAFWVFLAVVGCFLGSGIYYHRLEMRGSRRVRTVLAGVRGLLLALLVITMANPFLRVATTRHTRPTLYLLIDGTESMQIRDVTAAEGGRLPGNPGVRSRQEAVGQLLSGAFGRRLAEISRSDCRLEVFLFDGTSTSRLRRIEENPQPHSQWANQLVQRLTADGQVTALGAVLDDLVQHYTERHLAAVLLLSDFSHNSGPLPTSGEPLASLQTLGIPLYTIGVGQDHLIDLSVDLQVEPRMKRGEESQLHVSLRAMDLGERPADVVVRARRSSIDSTTGGPASILVGRRTLDLDEPVVQASFPFVPDQAGLWEFVASVEPLAGEVIHENNESLRRANVTDDHMQLLYVAFEPSWEWRFVKEALHRDPLVGLDGFRTYLDSSDPRVRRTNDLFVEEAVTGRDSFFAHDVVILDDLPQTMLSSQFCELIEEFVSRIGGGLVVLAGPRYGPGALANSSLAAMLPVHVDAQLALRDQQAFSPRFTASTDLFTFMRLSESPAESRQAWTNMGAIPWYQPVAGVHEQAFVLLEHPVDLCVDGRTPQPLAAVRRYGKGEVVYLGFNELWRLRRGYGELYHRRFWSQLIYRLGMSHALGSAKRFVASTDRDQYRADDFVTFTVDAYNADFEPLGEGDVSDGVLRATLTTPAANAGTGKHGELVVPALRDGVFETRFRVTQPGNYAIRLTDPLTGAERELLFDVTDATAERQDPVRDALLQRELAERTGGNAYDIADAEHLLQDLDLQPKLEPSIQSRPLWNTPLWFILVAGIMLSEWLARRWMHLK